MVPWKQKKTQDSAKVSKETGQPIQKRSNDFTGGLLRAKKDLKLVAGLLKRS